MPETRIIIMARTLRRDFPSLFILKLVLEKLAKASVVIVSQRDVHMFLKYWRPHALLIMNPSDAPLFEKHLPDLKLFYLPGEGGEAFQDYRERFFLENVKYLDLFERIFVWGPKIVEHMLRDDKQMHGGAHSDAILAKKVKVAGHQRLDMSRFFPARKQVKSIGILTHFSTINCYDNRTSLNLTFGFRDKITNIENEAALLRAITEITDYIVENTEYNVSIRPYPLENPIMYYSKGNQKTYFNNNKYNGRVSIDEHPDCSGWMAEQGVVFSSATTAVSEALLLGTPIVFIDKMAKLKTYNIYQSEINCILSDIVPNPETFEDLTQYIHAFPSIESQLDQIKPFWRDYYNMDQPGSAILRIASEITRCLESGRHDKKPLLPWRIIDLADQAAFRLLRGLDAGQETFHYSRSFHKPPSYYEAIASNILDVRGKTQVY